MKLESTFTYNQVLEEPENAQKYYKAYGFLVVENVFSLIQCQEMKKRAERLVEEDKSLKTIGFSLKKNNHHSDNNFLSSAYKINYFYEDEMIDKNGNFIDKKINCISKLGHCLHDLDKVFKKFSYNKKFKNLLDIINLKNPTLSQSSYIFKQPFIGGEYLWHQDSTYLLTKPLSCTAIWTAIDDANENNGCLYVIPGSHVENIRKRVKHVKGQIIRETLNKKDWVDGQKYPLCAKKGSIILFHGSLAHKSSKNTSNLSRNAYVLHFFSRNTEYCKDNWLQRPKDFPFTHYT